jgi:hypothetical protein
MRGENAREHFLPDRGIPLGYFRLATNFQLTDARSK